MLAVPCICDYTLIYKNYWEIIENLIMTKPKHWQIVPRITPEAEESLKAFPPIIRQLLYNRGYASDEAARKFLKASVGFDTSPWQLKCMEKVIDRLEEAILKQEPVVIYGDYDVDGVTATVLLVQVLKSLGAFVHEYIPNRFDEGYGLNTEALDSIKSDGAKVVITVDCGIRSIDEIEYARSLALDLIVSDHHHPGEILPRAFAIINPKQQDDLYPDKDLAGVGVAFKIAEALLERFPDKGINKDDLLDLVALGTVADLAPLIGENRSLVRRGLRQLTQTQRQGIFSLAAVAGVDLNNVNASNIGFGLGPRLNAAGRLDSALAAFNLLITQDVFEAGHLAQKLEIQNRDRQQVTRSMQAQAEKLVHDENPDAFLIFAVDSEFNPGVVGLAASRLSELYYRPAIVASRGDDTTRGSCRSIPEFHITEALEECEDLLVRYGGHAAAAGFTVENSKLPELKQRLISIAERQLKGRDLLPSVSADIKVSLSELNSKLLEQLAWFEPTGYGNPEPVFVSEGVKVSSSRAVGNDGKHLKLSVTDGYSHFDAIAFRMGDLQPTLPTYIDMVYTFELNEFNGRKNLQLNVREIKPSEKLD